jgi:MoaA/NifB/PqqE/SkfB family radical SAM enzyme
MCNGYFSSSIRKNRENLPATVNPYDEGFVNQLDDFIPYLTDARFLGGEPFLIDIYYSIWEKIRKQNPAMRLHITTNATVLNNRVKELIEDLNVHFVISVDSIQKESYEAIRINARFDRMMENWKYFYDYTRRKKTQMSFAVCPIKLNWQEIPGIVEFCNQHSIQVYFNTVTYPRELSLETMPAAELHKVISFMESANIPSAGYVPAYNKRMYDDMLNQLRAWHQRAL